VAADGTVAALVNDLAAEVPRRLPLSSRARTAVQLLTVIAAALAAATVALGVTITSHWHDGDALDRARDDALVAARQEIVNLDSLNHATIDADLARVVEGATGTFKDQFTRAQGDLKSVILQRKSVSIGTVLKAGVVRADTDTATVLVADDRTVKDSTDTSGAVAHDRWRVDLEKHGGHWLVSDLQPVA
jgi:Mce-associated membrane protein